MMYPRTQNRIGGWMMFIMGTLMITTGIFCAYLYVFDGFALDDGRGIMLFFLTIGGGLPFGFGIETIRNNR